MKKIDSSELKKGDEIEIKNFSNIHNAINATLQLEHSIKNRHTLLQKGTKLIFQKIDSEREGEFLFFVPGFAPRIKVWVEKNSLEECIID